MPEYAEYELQRVGGSQGFVDHNTYPTVECPICRKDVGGGYCDNGVHLHMKAVHKNVKNIKRKWFRDALLEEMT